MADWRLTWGDVSFGPDDLTAGDLALAHVLSGQGWEAADPTLSPHHAVCLIGAVVGRVTGRPPMEVVAEVQAVPAPVLFRAFKRPDPPDAGVAAVVPTPQPAPATAA